jgi:transposase
MGQTVRLVLRVSRFRCTNEACPRKTFTERLPKVVPVYARCTSRLITVLRAVALEAGAETGARVLHHVGIQTSGDTLLRIMRRTPEEPCPEPRVVGIDDWAFKKRLRYGTILVDLERHRPLDLLPDRQAETVAQWLQQHPGIEIVTRDRSQEYANATSVGAPQAIQVADRWHLLKNLGDALQQVLEKYAVRLRRWSRASLQTPLIQSMDIPDRILSRREQEQRTTRRAARLDRFEQVHRLHQLGWSQVAIGRSLGLSAKTIRRYLAAEVFPEHRARTMTSQLDPYKAYLLQRWNEGCHNAVQLRREIVSQGYPGGITQVRDYLARLRKAQANVGASVIPTSAPSETLSATSPLTPRRTAYWLLQAANPDNDMFSVQFFQHFPELQPTVELFQEFATMVRERREDLLSDWMQRSLACDCAPLRKFVRGLQHDETAVRAALSEFWSNGQTEGQVNRLKFIKRQMYGRAKFDLLRLRVLHSP